MPTNTFMWTLKEWDNLVKATYGKPYSFQQQDGTKERGIFTFTVPDYWPEEDPFDDSIPAVVNGDEMGVSFATWLATPADHVFNPGWKPYQTEYFWERNFYPDVDMIIRDLYQKGLIQEGEHIINIDW